MHTHVGGSHKPCTIADLDFDLESSVERRMRLARSQWSRHSKVLWQLHNWHHLPCLERRRRLCEVSNLTTKVLQQLHQGDASHHAMNLGCLICKLDSLRQFLTTISTFWSTCSIVSLIPYDICAQASPPVRYSWYMYTLVTHLLMSGTTNEWSQIQSLACRLFPSIPNASSLYTLATKRDKRYEALHVWFCHTACN